MLSLGSSKPWPDAMEVLTNNRKMEATAILEYFAPLYEWLIKTNEANGVEIGWDLNYGKLGSILRQTLLKIKLLQIALLQLRRKCEAELKLFYIDS